MAGGVHSSGWVPSRKFPLKLLSMNSVTWARASGEASLRPSMHTSMAPL